MIRVAAPLALLVALSSIASADVSPSDISISSFDPNQAVSPITSVEGPGVKVGEGTVIHPVFGIETGVISNVFYEANNPVSGGVLRLLAQIGFGSFGSDRLGSTATDSTAPASWQYRVSLSGSYDQMLSTNDTVNSTGGLGLGGIVHAIANPAGRWSFGIDDNYQRLIRAANFETDANTNRDINGLQLTLNYHPSDQAITGYAYYSNTIDVFEQSTQSFADRLQNRFGLHPMWKIFPETTIYIDASLGIYSGIDGSRKESSLPLLAVAGVSTLLSLRTTFNLQAGYANGFYGGGTPSYSAPVVDASIGYRYSELGRVVLSYDWMYADSVDANFYRDNVIRLWVQQLIPPFVFMVQPEIHFREYDGVATIIPGATDTRDDFIFSVVAGLQYNFRNWIGASLSYDFTDVSTNYRYMAGAVPNVDPSFMRHELLLGVRIAM